MTKQFIWIVWTFIFFLTATEAVFEETNPETIFKELRSLPQRTDFFSDYYDMHGNARQSLQALMIGRFKFTTNVCNELDLTEPKSFPAYVAALYDVLF